MTIDSRPHDDDRRDAGDVHEFRLHDTETMPAATPASSQVAAGPTEAGLGGDTVAAIMARP